MRKTQMDAYVRNALSYLDANQEMISKLQDGCAASFGADVISMGLLPTVAVYGKKKNKEDDKKNDRELPKTDRELMSDAILAVLKEDNDAKAKASQTLLDYVKNEKSVSAYQKKEFALLASTALKIALRTYGKKAPQKKEETADAAE